MTTATGSLSDAARIDMFAGAVGPRPFALGLIEALEGRPDLSAQVLELLREHFFGPTAPPARRRPQSRPKRG
jgi:hypothetical protein